MNKFTVAASVLSADFARLGEEASNAIAAGADAIHLDVMDNHYVPNLTFGAHVCRALRQYGITAPLDTHLMVKPVDSLIQEFAKAGATSITIHPESSEHLDRSLQMIRDLGCKAGLAFNPSTPLNYLKYVIDKVDIILLMTVNPGFGGQSFISSLIPKIHEAYNLTHLSHKDICLQIDGGIKVDNIRQVANAGADSFVCGSAIFASEDYTDTIKQLREQLAAAKPKER